MRSLSVAYGFNLTNLSLRHNTCATLATTAAKLRRPISPGVRGSWEAGGRVVELVTALTAGGAGAVGRAGIAAGMRGTLGRTIAGLGTTSRRPRNAAEWAEGRGGVVTEFAAPGITRTLPSLFLSSGGSDARQ